MPLHEFRCDDGHKTSWIDGVVDDGPRPEKCSVCGKSPIWEHYSFSCQDTLNPWQTAAYDSLPATQRYNAWFKENERELRDKGYVTPSTDECRAATDDPDIFAEERKRIEKRADLLDSIDRSCAEAEMIVRETKGNPEGIERFKKDAIKDDTPSDIPTGGTGGKELESVVA